MTIKNNIYLRPEYYVIKEKYKDGKSFKFDDIEILLKDNSKICVIKEKENGLVYDIRFYDELPKKYKKIVEKNDGK